MAPNSHGAKWSQKRWKASTPRDLKASSLEWGLRFGYSMRKTAGIITVSKIPKFPCDIFRPWPSARTWSEQWKRAKSSPCGTCRPQGIYHHLPRGAFPKPERIVSFRHPLNGTMWYPKWKVHGEGVKRCWMLSKWQTRSSSISTSKSIKN